MMLAGALAGGAWAFIPAILRARLGVNEIITTLMLNYVALQWSSTGSSGPGARAASSRRSSSRAKRGCRA